MDGNSSRPEPGFWVGYCEHNSPALLNVFDANIGKGGYTIFAQMIFDKYRRRLWGLPWCAVFVHAVVNRPDLLGKPHPGTRVLARRMRRAGLWRGRDYTPCPGDIIFLSNSRTKRIDHCGIIESCDGDYETSIEGNARDDAGRFQPQEGGVVARRTRELTDTLIVGYGAIHDK